MATKEWLLSHEHMTLEEQGKILGCGKQTVVNLRRRAGIPPFNKFIDLKGKTFGDREIIERDSERKSKNKRSNRTYWFCRCKCGKIDSVSTCHLLHGKGQSCVTCAKYKGIGDLSLSYYKIIESNALYRDIDFKVSHQFLWNLFLKQEGKCALSGVTLEIGKESDPIRKRLGKERTASLDRINSSLPYIEENVQWIHKDIQKMKWELPEDKFINWCGIIYKNKRKENE